MWFSSSSAAAILTAKLQALNDAETRLLSYVGQFHGPGGETELDIRVQDTMIPQSSIPLSNHGCSVYSEGDDYRIHSVHIQSKDKQLQKSDSSPPLVLLHGYMNGASYFYRNFAGLSQYFPSIHSLDVIGSGLSSRPINPFNSSSTVEQTEDVFCESLEEWRKQNKIDKMVLAGHSMGGYLSVAYTERYPQNVDKLILLSPVGVPDEPAAGSEEQQSKRSLSRRMMFSAFRYLFDNQYTPGGFLRSLSESRSRGMIESYVLKRLPAIAEEEERQAVSDYLFHNVMLPGSTEASVNRFLTTPYLIAKQPLVDRIPKLDVPSVTFLYGSHDWMDVAGGLKTQLQCEEVTRTGKTAPAVDVYRVDQAGHLLMLDNWQEFNAGVALAAGVDKNVLDRQPAKLSPIRDMPVRKQKVEEERYQQQQTEPVA